MKNIKTFALSIGLLGATVIALGWWCQVCADDHQGPCPKLQAWLDCGYGCSGYGCSGYACDDGYDSDGADQFIEMIRQRRAAGHQRNLHAIINANDVDTAINMIGRHVHNEEDARSVLDELTQAYNRTCEVARGADARVLIEGLRSTYSRISETIYMRFPQLRRPYAAYDCGGLGCYGCVVPFAGCDQDFGYGCYNPYGC